MMESFFSSVVLEDVHSQRIDIILSLFNFEIHNLLHNIT